MDRSLPANSRPLIVTARLDPESHKYFNDLRAQHFPPERNHLPAHLTMFHAFPGETLADVSAVLSNVASREKVLSAGVRGVRSLGNGVAFTLHSADLERVRGNIAETVTARLTQQDAQKWRPHITIQNKVSSEIARQLLASLQVKFQPWTISVEGLDLWHYDGGPWELIQGFHFGTQG